MTSLQPRALIVDDDETVRFGITDFLTQNDFVTAEAGTCEAAVDAFRNFFPDIAILDYALPDGNALDLLPRLKTLSASTPIIILTGHGSIDLAVKTIKAGAEQFLTKPVDLHALFIVIERILENQRNRNKQMAQRRDRAPQLNPFIGSSAAIRRVHDQAARIAGAQRPILIHGETGSGKGVLAKWLHAQGPRSNAAFVDLNCAGLSKEFLESELFGHERGAFTGATASKVGLFDVAHRGTMFLDEIGDIDLNVQPKLLKVLEEKRFHRLGDVKDRVVDVQLIAASHRDLRRLVQERSFRSDLYFRISTLQIDIPPLRQRKEDIAAISDEILLAFASERGLAPVRIAPDALRAMQQYRWPGNIREMRNVIERALLLCDGAELQERDLSLDTYAVDDEDQEPTTIDEIERRHIVRTLRQLGSNVEATSRRLGIPRSSLYRKLKKYGITILKMGRTVPD
ncbi:MAG TPA: sigma-54 dependent transcriptional regulator [Thermoanaerobaculia bacterium]